MAGGLRCMGVWPRRFRLQWTEMLCTINIVHASGLFHISYKIFMESFYETQYNNACIEICFIKSFVPH